MLAAINGAEPMWFLGLAALGAGGIMCSILGGLLLTCETHHLIKALRIGMAASAAVAIAGLSVLLTN